MDNTLAGEGAGTAGEVVVVVVRRGAMRVAQCGSLNGFTGVCWYAVQRDNHLAGEGMGSSDGNRPMGIARHE